MIKPQHLRIGNIVNILSESDNIIIPNGETMIISEITWGGVTEILPGREQNIRLSYSLIDPIPLTEDWLKKFGFIKEQREGGEVAFCLSENDCNVIVHDFGEGYLFVWELSFMGRPLKYVHQLQNLYFALTGSELTTK